eukprot:3505945-Amphidinium_carterae.1
MVSLQSCHGQAREVAAMSGAELYTVRYEVHHCSFQTTAEMTPPIAQTTPSVMAQARYQLTKLRGELEEYKWCAKSRAQQSR